MSQGYVHAVIAICFIRPARGIVEISSLQSAKEQDQ